MKTVRIDFEPIANTGRMHVVLSTADGVRIGCGCAPLGQLAQVAGGEATMSVILADVSRAAYIDRIHFSPGCACGTNDAGTHYTDPICAHTRNRHRSREINDTRERGMRMYQARALQLIRDYIERRLEKTDEPPTFEVYIVWWCKALQNWKALVSTTLPDQMYYEVTHNGDKGETYIDAYKKFDNVCVSDE